MLAATLNEGDLHGDLASDQSLVSVVGERCDDKTSGDLRNNTYKYDNLAVSEGCVVMLTSLCISDTCLTYGHLLQNDPTTFCTPYVCSLPLRAGTHYPHVT